VDAVEENIYKTPQSDVETFDAVKGSPTKAIVIATLVDVVGTVVVGIVIGVIYSAILAADGLQAEEIAKRLENVAPLSLYSLIGIASGCVITTYAGYLCAKKVNYSEYKVVSIYIIISVAFGFLLGGSTYPAVGMLILSLLTVLCAYTGAWLHVSRKARKFG
jgi:uncharacterized membrane protein AbrB (regulator of aidB expression)